MGQDFARDCNYAAKCKDFKAPAVEGSVYARDEAKVQQIEDDKQLLCANIVPATICSQCGDSRTDYCKLIAFCNMEADCAARPANSGYDSYVSKEPVPVKPQPFNVKIKTKGTCPGANFEGDDTTVQIELDSISNPSDVKDQLLTQIN